MYRIRLLKNVYFYGYKKKINKSDYRNCTVFESEK